MDAMERYYAKEIGERIGRLRKDHGMTQAQLSEKINIAEKHLSALERGKYKPSAETIYYIAQEFSVTVDYLLTGNPAQPLNSAVEEFLKESSQGQQEAVWRFLREVTKSREA